LLTELYSTLHKCSSCGFIAEEEATIYSVRYHPPCLTPMVVIRISKLGLNNKPEKIIYDAPFTARNGK